MSAFVVSTKHIDYLVMAAIAYNQPYGSVEYAGERVTFTTANHVGAALLAECIASVRYRYDDYALDDLPGPTPTPAAIDYHFPATRTPPPLAVAVLKAINCYRYQSCEHPGWRASAAYAFCDALESAAINRLPGYKEAPWEIHDYAELHALRRTLHPTT